MSGVTAAKASSPGVASSPASEPGLGPGSGSGSGSGPAPIGDSGLSSHCVSDRPKPEGLAPKGELRTMGDVDVYVSKPSSYPQAPARLLLLLTGGTGLRSANNQIQADQYAEAGYVVVMPDLFGGDVAPNATLSEEAEAEAETETGAETGAETEALAPGGGGSGGSGGVLSSLLGRFKIKAVETAKSFMIDMWLARHTEERVMPILQRVLEASRSEFADAVASGDGIYAAGYCFGGRYVLLLARAEQPQAAADVEAGPARPLIRAGCLAHATLVSRDDFAGLQAPVSLACVEDDPMFSDEVRKAGEDYLTAHNVEHEVQVYPGVPHGFAVVGDYADENIKTAQAIAFAQMINWLDGH